MISVPGLVIVELVHLVCKVVGRLVLMNSMSHKENLAYRSSCIRQR